MKKLLKFGVHGIVAIFIFSCVHKNDDQNNVPSPEVVQLDSTPIQSDINNDEELKLISHQLDSLLPNFYFGYVDLDFRAYYHSYWGNGFSRLNDCILSGVDSTGNLLLTSNTSKEVDHTSVTVNVGNDLELKTSVLEDPPVIGLVACNCYVETNVFTDSSENGIIQAIAENQDKRIKVTLSGNKDLRFELSMKEKAAFKDVFKLSELLKAKRKLVNHSK